MAGTAMERQKVQVPEQSAQPVVPVEPVVIDVRAKPVTTVYQGDSRVLTLARNGLDLLTSLTRLALMWIENREPDRSRLDVTTRESRVVPRTSGTFAAPVVGRGQRGGRRRRRRRGA